MMITVTIYIIYMYNVYVYICSYMYILYRGHDGGLNNSFVESTVKLS